MMELECGVYKPSTASTLANPSPSKSIPLLSKICVAEDLSMPTAKKKHKKELTKKIQNNNSDENEHENSSNSSSSQVDDNPLLRAESIIQVMDIQEPLTNLRALLQVQLGGIDLSHFQIWLQDKYKMNPENSLGEQCIQAEGLAQIKVELKQVLGQNRINIIDVLKLSDDENDDDDDESSVEDLSVKNLDQATSASNFDDKSIRWTICKDFNSLFPIHLPNNPKQWSEIQIRHWLRWAMNEFSIEQVNDSMWSITGDQLCQWSIEDFRKNVPNDISDRPISMLFTHFELLRKCHVFAIVDKGHQPSQISLTQKTIKPSQKSSTISRKPRTSSSSSTNGINKRSRPSMTGNNGQIQLWQFLLELLGDKSKKNVIQWVGRDGEFKLNDPELVAQMWGERKNKPKMNYEKLSRALRYYYSESMIAKVQGRRFVYRFVCNLQELVGYTSEELISLVEDDENDS